MFTRMEQHPMPKRICQFNKLTDRNVVLFLSCLSCLFHQRMNQIAFQVESIEYVIESDFKQVVQFNTQYSMLVRRKASNETHPNTPNCSVKSPYIPMNENRKALKLRLAQDEWQWNRLILIYWKRFLAFFSPHPRFPSTFTLRPQSTWFLVLSFFPGKTSIQCRYMTL